MGLFQRIAARNRAERVGAIIEKHYRFCRPTFPTSMHFRLKCALASSIQDSRWQIGVPSLLTDLLPRYRNIDFRNSKPGWHLLEELCYKYTAFLSLLAVKNNDDAFVCLADVLREMDQPGVLPDDRRRMLTDDLSKIVAIYRGDSLMNAYASLMPNDSVGQLAPILYETVYFGLHTCWRLNLIDGSEFSDVTLVSKVEEADLGDCSTVNRLGIVIPVNLRRSVVY